MKSKLQFIIVTLSLVFSLTAHATDWKDLIGKELVLDRWGNVRDGWFSDYHPMNTMGADPVERIILKDAAHVVWNYTQQGDFARECSLQGPVLTFNEPIFGNKEMRILKAEGDVILTLGGDSLTRAFYILNPQPDAQTEFDEAMERYGEDATVIAMPFGGATLPMPPNAAQT